MVFLHINNALKNLEQLFPFFSSAVMSIYTYIYITYLNPEIITNSLELTEQTLLQSDPEISDEMLETQLQFACCKVYAATLDDDHDSFRWYVYGIFIFIRILSFFTKKSSN